MNDRELLNVYVSAYKQAGDPAGGGSGKAPTAKADLTEKALSYLRKRGKGAMRMVGKGLEGASKGLQNAGKEGKCAKCGNVMSKCACGKKC